MNEPVQGVQGRGVGLRNSSKEGLGLWRRLLLWCWNALRVQRRQPTVALRSESPRPASDAPSKPAKTKLKGRKPIPGYVFNPLKSYPRNEPCFCGSKIKAKKCCINKLKDAVPAHTVERLSAFTKAAHERRAGARG